MNPPPPPPRYPVYVPSKGRADTCLTADCLVADGVPFRLVVEPQEADLYRERYGAERVLVLPFRDQGSVVPARNWIREHSESEGAERHWQVDDNIRCFRRWYKGKRVPVEAGIGLRVCEDLTDRYENVGISGLNYTMFSLSGGGSMRRLPMILNVHVYSCTLFLNALPYRWRGRYNEDTDICLQVLSSGEWCTLQLNAFTVDKQRTQLMRGGNTETLYRGDGRLRMARSLERLWPGVVTTKRRWQRPQHMIAFSWGRFDTPLRLRPGVDLAGLPPIDEYGMAVKVLKEPRSARIRRIAGTAAPAGPTLAQRAAALLDGQRAAAG